MLPPHQSNTHKLILLGQNYRFNAYHQYSQLNKVGINGLDPPLRRPTCMLSPLLFPKPEEPLSKNNPLLIIDLFNTGSYQQSRQLGFNMPRILLNKRLANNALLAR